MAVPSYFTREKEKGLGSWILSVSPRPSKSTHGHYSTLYVGGRPYAGVFVRSAESSPWVHGQARDPIGNGKTVRRVSPEWAVTSSPFRKFVPKGCPTLAFRLPCCHEPVKLIDKDGQQALERSIFPDILPPSAPVRHTQGEGVPCVPCLPRQPRPIDLRAVEFRGVDHEMRPSLRHVPMVSPLRPQAGAEIMGFV